LLLRSTPKVATTTVARIRTTLIDVALNPELGQAVRPQLSSDNPGEPRISLLRCLARTDYLANVLGAAERAMPKKALSGLTVLVFARHVALGDNRFFALTVQPNAALVRLRARVSRAIAPGLASGDDLSDPIWLPSQPIYVPELTSKLIPPFIVRVGSAAIYSLDYAGNSVEKLLRTWTL